MSATGAVGAAATMQQPGHCERRASAEQQPVGQAPRRLAREAAHCHRGCEDTGAEPADGGLGVQLALQEERAPALRAAFDDEGDRPDDPDDHETRRETQPVRAGHMQGRAVGGDEESGQRDARRDGNQDLLLPCACAAREARADRTGQHADRIGAVRERLQSAPGHVLDATDVRVDRHVDETRCHPACCERDHERGQRSSRGPAAASRSRRTRSLRRPSARRSGRSRAARRGTSPGSIRRRRRASPRRALPSTGRSTAGRSAGPPPMRPRRAPARRSRPAPARAAESSRAQPRLRSSYTVIGSPERPRPGPRTMNPSLAATRRDGSFPAAMYALMLSVVPDRLQRSSIAASIASVAMPSFRRPRSPTSPPRPRRERSPRYPRRRSATRHRRGSLGRGCPGSPRDRSRAPATARPRPGCHGPHRRRCPRTVRARPRGPASTA